VLFLLWEIDRNVPAAYIRKWNIWDVISGVAMSWESTVLIVIWNCFAKCGFGTLSEVRAEQDEEYSQWVEFKSHMDCPTNFLKFLSVSKPIPTDDQKTILGGPSCEHMVTVVATEEEEKMEEVHLLPVYPACKDALMALLVLRLCYKFM
jgi:hypothetical protein